MNADMDADVFVQQVQGEARLADARQARAATEATLRTLGEHLSAGEAADVDALLPEGLRGFLTATSDETPAEFSVEEFYRRVAEREDADPEAATTHVRAVMAALAATVGVNELQDVRQQLPNEFDSVFEPPEPDASEP